MLKSFETKYFFKTKSVRIRGLFRKLKLLTKDDSLRESPDWVFTQSGNLGLNPKLLTLLQNQIKTPYNKYSFFLPATLFQVQSGFTYVKWIDANIDFEIKDPTRYLKRVEWVEHGFIFCLGRKSSVKKYSKNEIQEYLKKSETNKPENYRPSQGHCFSEQVT